MFTYIENWFNADSYQFETFTRISCTSAEIQALIEGLFMTGFGSYTVLNYAGDIVAQGES